MSCYHPKGHGEWGHLHNALCRAIAGFAAQAHVSSVMEGGRVRGTNEERRSPAMCASFAGDVGAHGWAAAAATSCGWMQRLPSRWASHTCPPRPPRAALPLRWPAAGSINTTPSEYRNDISGHVHFLPLRFESEGCHCAELERLLLAACPQQARFQRQPAARAAPEANLKATARRWLSYWLDHLAVVHARYVARCVYNRASACKDAGNPSCRLVSTLDADG
jgi:hypothetical protein